MIVRNHMAILRNLRNIREAGVSDAHLDKLRRALTHSSWANSRILPFRFIAVAKVAPHLEDVLEQAMFRTLSEKPKLPGRTAILVDVSGSMDAPLSDKSDMTRVDAACGVAMVGRELCDKVEVFSFSQRVVDIPNRRGFALKESIARSQAHEGTYLGGAVSQLNKSNYDRLIVISDEQSHDTVPAPVAKNAYMLNVGTYRNGVGYGGGWLNISGFSEGVFNYILAAEGNLQPAGSADETVEA